MNEVMNGIPTMVYTIIILIGFCALLGAVYYALKNGKLSSDALKVGVSVLDGMQQSAQALAKATGNSAISIAAFILEAGTRAAHAAEQMYKTGEIDKDERNKTAKEIAEDLLKLAGIEVTEDRKTALAVAIEAECDAMGHGMELSGVATVSGTAEEMEQFAKLMEKNGVKLSAEESAGSGEESETVEAAEDSLARGYDTEECKGDGEVYAAVTMDDGLRWKKVSDCTDEELDAAIRANRPKADTTNMTHAEKTALLTALVDEENSEE